MIEYMIHITARIGAIPFNPLRAVCLFILVKKYAYC